MSEARTLTLTDFLLARIEEDETVARVAIGRTEVNEFGEMLNFDMWHQQDWIEIGDAQLVHVRRHDPARVLAECEAKRKQIAHLVEFMEGDYAPWNETQLEIMASVYADHPNYREEWR